MEKIIINEDRLIVETQEIFKYLDKNIYDKIPNKIKNLINGYKGKYKFTYDETKKLNDQNISQETKDLIVGLYYKYAASDASKKIIMKNIEENERRILEEEKRLREKYSPDNLFKDNLSNHSGQCSETQVVVMKKESMFKRIINKIRLFFKKG